MAGGYAGALSRPDRGFVSKIGASPSGMRRLSFLSTSSRTLSPSEIGHTLRTLTCRPIKAAKALSGEGKSGHTSQRGRRLSGTGLGSAPRQVGQDGVSRDKGGGVSETDDARSAKLIRWRGQGRFKLAIRLEWRPLSAGSSAVASRPFPINGLRRICYLEVAEQFSAVKQFPHSIAHLPCACRVEPLATIQCRIWR